MSNSHPAGKLLHDSILMRLADELAETSAIVEAAREYVAALLAACPDVKAILAKNIHPSVDSTLLNLIHALEGRQDANREVVRQEVDE